MSGAIPVGLALALDLAFEEYPERVHPVAVYGDWLARFDRPWQRPRLVGVLVGLVVPLAAASAIAGIVAVATTVHWFAGAVTAGFALFASTSLRMLLSVAAETIALTETDISAARDRVRALVGRDPAHLEPAEVRSAAVESLAENLADGLVAPLFAFALLSPWLPLAVAGAVWVKAVNTADSVLGYPDKPVGWTCARLDDVVMWVPARLTACLLALVSLEPSALLRAKRSAATPPSPNSGWPMATMAEILGVELEKPGAYRIGEGTPPTVGAAEGAIRVTAAAGGFAFLLAGVIAWL